MLGAHLEAERPADTSCPGDPQAGTDPGKTAQCPRESGGAEELLRLRRQVAGLHRQLQRQEARWSAALRHLQAQIDALKRRDRGPPRGGRGDAELQAPGAGGTPAAPLQLRSRADTQVLKSTPGTTSPLSADGDITPTRAGRRSHRARLRGQGLSLDSAPSSQPASVKIERIHSGEMVTREEGDKTVSISLRIRGAAAARRGPRAEGRPAPPGAGTAAAPPGRSPPTPSGRTPAGPAACSAPPTEGGPAAQDTDARPSPSPSEGPEGKSLTRARTDGLAGPSPDAEPQNRPVDPESSQPTGTATGEEVKEEETRSPDGKVCCRAGARTTRAAHPSRLGVPRFPNRRTEKSYPDGSEETVFPDGTVRRLRDGREETVFPDGTSVSVERNGDRTIVLSNGQRDIHTARFKRREYPDGTVRTVYDSGLQETKFTSGRVRVRHEAGSIVLDQTQAVHHSQ